MQVLLSSNCSRSGQESSHAGASIVALQVADAKVLIPTTGLVSAQDINAVKDLRLITNSAAGLLADLLISYADRHSSICCK